jgi:hypothetical protein|tara:strand:+ start:104 stop:688 length:585 start_codon:yes stop_codon:yes gene_type:complete
MPSERTGYAPWSLTREAGVQSATVDGTIKVPQNIQPVLDTGFVDEKGDWKGVKSSDETFFIDATHEGIPNGSAVLSPQTADRDFIDMTGFKNLMIALKITNTGNYGIEAVMGTDTNPFANLTPVDSASPLRAVSVIGNNFDKIVSDSVEVLTADVWEVLSIQGGNLAGQKNLQFKLTNNSGGNSDITFAYLRLV